MPKLVALTSAVWSVSAFCGPMVGGVFANTGEWRLAYWAFAGQALLFILLVLATIPRGKASDGTAESKIPGLRLMLVAAGVLLIATAGAHPDPIFGPLMVLGAVIVLGAFLYLDARQRGNGMLPPSPFSTDTVYGTGLLTVVLLGCVTMSLVAYGTFFLERLFDVTPLAAGFIIAVESVSWGVAAVIFANANLSAERWLIRGGALVVTIGIAGLAVTMPTGSLLALLPFAVFQGMGFGMMWGFVIRRIIAGAVEGERERTSAAVMTVQQFGVAVGAAASGGVANVLGFAEDASLDTIRSVAFWIFAAFLPIAFGGVWAAWRFSRDTDRSGPLNTASKISGFSSKSTFR